MEKGAFGGRIYYDAVGVMSWDDSLTAYAGSSSEGIFPRSVRFYSSGRIYEHIDYKLGIDFSGGLASLKCACLRVDQVPRLGRISVGHLKEPFGLEELTSANYLTFMERSLTAPFTPSRNFGLMLNNQAFDSRATWWIGAFRDTDDRGMAIGHWRSSLSFTGRVTALPYLSDDNKRLIHLGLAFRRSMHDSLIYRSSPGVRLQPDFSNTQYIHEVSGWHQGGMELAAVFGPLSVQGEYMSTSFNRPVYDTITGNSKAVNARFSSAYVQVGIFLTPGDQRAYSLSSATFDRVRPRKRLGANGGWGALELAARYARLDLVDGKHVVQENNFTGSSLIAGGVTDNITIGVNWYLNPATRLMVNYSYSGLANAGGEAHPDKVINIGQATFLQTRFQVDF